MIVDNGKSLKKRLLSFVLVFVFLFGFLASAKFFCDYVLINSSGDYSKELSATAYNDVVYKQNVNLVFYKKSCPYCKAAKDKIIEESKGSLITTFYVDVTTADGKSLAEHFGVVKAPTIVMIRDGEVSIGYYAYDEGGEIMVDNEYIEEVFNGR
ncbi:thioredoxin domain-containing protein [Streptococcus sp. H31]|uniref:thioredoxin domain-containing protein n=1 Tax=Streptococcus huangxiaojuni TaxID=3237239 RepID=UPI0034A36F89